MKSCKICGKQFEEQALVSGYGIRHQIEKLIQSDHPDWTDKDWICQSDFNFYRLKYTQSVVSKERTELEELEKDVLKSLSENELITADISAHVREPMKIGEAISDKVASFGGSWKFIIIFFVVLLIWIVLNTVTLLLQPFDPYPFILMNLILSCLAAIQAPIIMMSQNRQETKDRLRSENDYKINLKSEIEIRTLHEKVDHLLLNQWSKLMEVQDLQIELLEEIRKNFKPDTP
jgi:uncharacterized membrane protein